MNTCEGCRLPVGDNELMQCSSCVKVFHYRCLNMKKENYVKLSKANRANWKCAQCKASVPKGDNTPIRLGGSTADLDRQVKLKTSSHSSHSLSDTDEPQALEELLSKRFSKIESTMKSLIQAEFDKLSAEVKSLREMKTSFDMMSAKYDEMSAIFDKNKTEVDSLRKDNAQLHETVKDLTVRLTLVEQKSRDCNIELQCLPEHSSEKLVNTMLQLATVVSCHIEDADIKSCTRVSKINATSTRPRSVVCTLSSPRKRDSLLAACILFNKGQRNPADKLNTSHLGIGGDKSSIYIAEHLSPANKALQAQARIFKKDFQYKHLWVRGGRVMLRLEDASPAIWVKNSDVLSQLRKSTQENQLMQTVKG